MRKTYHIGNKQWKSLIEISVGNTIYLPPIPKRPLTLELKSHLTI